MLWKFEMTQKVYDAKIEKCKKRDEDLWENNNTKKLEKIKRKL